MGRSTLQLRSLDSAARHHGGHPSPGRGRCAAPIGGPATRVGGLAAEGEAKEGGGDQEQEDAAPEQKKQGGEGEADGATERESQLLIKAAILGGIVHRSDNLAALSTPGAADVAAGKGPRGGPKSDRVH